MRLRQGLASPALLASGAVFVYGRHITDGGLYFDDWRAAEAQRIGGGLIGTAHGLTQEGLNYRPLQAVTWWIPNALFGVNSAAHLLYGTLLAALASYALFAALRAARVPQALALGAAALMLVFPFSDALRLWPAAAEYNWPLTFVLLGVAAGLRAPEGDGRRAWWLAGASALLFALAVLTYEQTLGIIAVGVLVSLLRRAWALAALQAAATAVATAVVLASSKAPHQPDLAGALRHERHMLAQAWEVLGRGVVPFAGAWRVGAVVAALVLVAGGTLIVRRGLSRTPLLLAGAGVLVIVASYVVLAPSTDYYAPLTPGQGTRTNAAAQVGWALLVTGLAGIAGSLVRREALALALVAVVGLGWVARSTEDARAWDTAWRVEQDVIAAARTSLGVPAPGTTVFAFGVPRATRPEVPVFLGPEDLGPALRLSLHGDFGSIPIQGETAVRCTEQGPVTEGGWIPPQTYARYGRAVFFDYAGRRALPVPDRHTCERLAPTLATGPLATEP